MENKELNDHLDNQQEENTPNSQDNNQATDQSEQQGTTQPEDQKSEAQTTQIQQLQQKIGELEEKLLRSAAETENLRRRYEKMIAEAADYSIFNFAKDLLAVMDNLTRALQHQPEKPDETVLNILTGVDMTKNELHSVFEKYGLEQIKPNTGEKFDYNLHAAISQIMSSDHDHDSIVDTMQTGYKIKDRLLRPAAVVVSKKS